jgi:hypothetical protein
MKKNKNLIVILIVLLAATGWFVITKKDSTLNNELTDFAIVDTNTVTKIFLADKRGGEITLTKQPNGKWLVNGKEEARPDGISLLLYTINTVEVRSPVGRSNYNRIIKNLSANGVKVEIYQNDKLSKTYYVGGPTQDQLGTEMYLENSSVPFITHIPGFNGFLTPRYFTNYYEWIDRTVFSYPAESIAQLSILNKNEKDGSFTIKYNDGLKKYELFDANNSLVTDANSKKVEGYLSFYQNMSYESSVYEIRPELYDSIKTVGSFIDIDITTKANKKQHAAFYRKPRSNRALGQVTTEGQTAPYDMDRIYTILDTDTMFLITQYELYNRLFKKVDEFKGDVPQMPAQR